MELTEIRVRSRIPKAELDKKVGRILTESDYNVRLTGATKVVGPGGQPLAIYLPNALSGPLNEEHYPVLHDIKLATRQRGLASGSIGARDNGFWEANKVRSATIGHFDNAYNNHRFPYCRTTAWTGEYTEEFSSLYPLFRYIGRQMERYVPKRYAVQWARAEATDQAWRVPGTPFTTMPVNNTYPTGVHKDKGDLDAGFSCLAVWRRGQYSGGHLTLPEWRIAVDMQDGDLLLMDAHQWHGNTDLVLESEDAERISLVLYYRTEMMACGTLEEELGKKIAAKTKAFRGGG